MTPQQMQQRMALQMQLNGQPQVVPVYAPAGRSVPQQNGDPSTDARAEALAARQDVQLQVAVHPALAAAGAQQWPGQAEGHLPGADRMPPVVVTAPAAPAPQPVTVSERAPLVLPGPPAAPAAPSMLPPGSGNGAGAALPRFVPPLAAPPPPMLAQPSARVVPLQNGNPALDARAEVLAAPQEGRPPSVAAAPSATPGPPPMLATALSGHDAPPPAIAVAPTVPAPRTPAVSAPVPASLPAPPLASMPGPAMLPAPPPRPVTVSAPPPLIAAAPPAPRASPPMLPPTGGNKPPTAPFGFAPSPAPPRPPMLAQPPVAMPPAAATPPAVAPHPLADAPSAAVITPLPQQAPLVSALSPAPKAPAAAQVDDRVTPAQRTFTPAYQPPALPSFLNASLVPDLGAYKPAPAMPGYGLARTGSPFRSALTSAPQLPDFGNPFAAPPPGSGAGIGGGGLGGGGGAAAVLPGQSYTSLFSQFLAPRQTPQF